MKFPSVAVSVLTAVEETSVSGSELLQAEIEENQKGYMKNRTRKMWGVKASFL